VSATEPSADRGRPSNIQYADGPAVQVRRPDHRRRIQWVRRLHLRDYLPWPRHMGQATQPGGL